MLRLKVLTVSTNANSFGLKSMILLADNGQGYQALSNEINLRPTGTVMDVDDINTTPELAIVSHLVRCGYECVTRLSQDAPQDAINTVFKCFTPLPPRGKMLRKTRETIQRRRH